MCKKILAIASGGGHWQELLLLSPAFAGNDVLYVTTLKGLAEQSGVSKARLVPDCNRSRPFQSLLTGLCLLRVFFSFRPEIVVSTGAMPGLMAMFFGKTVGARTIWVDSVANAEEMSLSGQSAKRFADLWLSQCSHVAEENDAEYAGSVL